MKTVYYLTNGRVVVRVGNKVHTVPTFYAGMSGKGNTVPVFETNMDNARAFGSREDVYEVMAEHGWDYFGNPYWVTSRVIFDQYDRVMM